MDLKSQQGNSPERRSQLSMDAASEDKSHFSSGHLALAWWKVGWESEGMSNEERLQASKSSIGFGPGLNNQGGGPGGWVHVC